MHCTVHFSLTNKHTAAQNSVPYSIFIYQVEIKQIYNIKEINRCQAALKEGGLPNKLLQNVCENKYLIIIYSWNNHKL